MCVCVCMCACLSLFLSCTHSHTRIHTHAYTHTHTHIHTQNGGGGTGGGECAYVARQVCVPGAWCVALCCSVLQCVAVRCSALQLNARTLLVKCVCSALDMNDIWMSHVTHTNESCRTYDRVISHIWMSHATHMIESRHTYEWVMSHVWSSHVTHMNECARLLLVKSVCPALGTRHDSSECNIARAWAISRDRSIPYIYQSLVSAISLVHVTWLTHMWHDSHTRMHGYSTTRQQCHSK